MQTKKLILKGRVQGVGMRYSIHQKAKELGLFGSVKNLSNGSVEVILQGSEDKLEAMLFYLNNDAPGQIDRIDQNEVKEANNYNAFKITF